LTNAVFLLKIDKKFKADACILIYIWEAKVLYVASFANAEL